MSLLPFYIAVRISDLYEHRVHTELQSTLSGEHSIMMEKLAQFGEGGGACQPSFTISTITYKVLVYALAEKATHYPYFYSTPICILCDYKYPTPLKGEEKRRPLCFSLPFSLLQLVIWGRIRIGEKLKTWKSLHFHICIDSYGNGICFCVKNVLCSKM
jgi:hypothetical protein